MSDATPTNEETLQEILRNLPPYHFISLRPSRNSFQPNGSLDMIDVAVVPNELEEDFPTMRESQRDEFIKARMMAIHMHLALWIALVRK